MSPHVVQAWQSEYQPHLKAPSYPKTWTIRTTAQTPTGRSSFDSSRCPTAILNQSTRAQTSVIMPQQSAFLSSSFHQWLILSESTWFQLILLSLLLIQPQQQTACRCIHRLEEKRANICETGCYVVNTASQSYTPSYLVWRSRCRRTNPTTAAKMNIRAVI